MWINFNNLIKQGAEYRKMSEFYWGTVQHFNIGENWGEQYQISIKLVYLLDMLRTSLGLAININNAYATSGHSDNSQHYLGRASDIHAKGVRSWDLAWLAMQLPFTGIGIYPYWTNPGIHVDVREMTYGAPRKMWWRNMDGQYYNIDSLDYWNQLLRDHALHIE